MITNDQLLKLFVLVPSTVQNFDGKTVSGAEGEHRIFFEQATGKLWAKGQSFGIDTLTKTAINTLIGDDDGKSVRTIAQEVVNGIMDWQSADADEVIDTLKEVLTWFNNLPEGDAGALELVTKVGKPAELYTAADELKNPEHAEGTVKTAATGLYKLIEDSIAGLNIDNYATKQHVEDRLGALGNASEAEGNTPAVPHTAKSYVDSKIGTLGNKVEAQAEVLYTAEDDEVIAGTKQVGDVKTPAVTAVPYTNVMEVVTDNELVTAAAINDLNDRIDNLGGESISGLSIGDVDATVTNNVAYISTSALQGELFENTYSSSPLSYTYMGVTVSLKEENGELTYLNVDPSGLANRVTALEAFDPWETYVAPVTPEPEP